MFNINNFIVPLNPNDVILKIRNTSNLIQYIIKDPYCTVIQIDKVLDIKQKAESLSIKLDFSSKQETTDAHILLRQALKQLAENQKENSGTNTQSDWNETDSLDDAFIKNKPSIIKSIPLAGTDINENVTGDIELDNDVSILTDNGTSKHGLKFKNEHIEVVNNVIKYDINRHNEYDNRTLVDKEYIDNLIINDIDIPDPSENQFFAKTLTRSVLASNVYTNGTSGVGARLTGSVNGLIKESSYNAGYIGGTSVLVYVNDIILVKTESDKKKNGLYKIIDLGSPSSKYILERTDDYDSTSEINDSQISILEGDEKGRFFIQTTKNPIIGTSDIVYITGFVFSPPFNLVLIDTVTTEPLPSFTYTIGASLTSPGSGAKITLNSNGVFPTINGVVPRTSMLVLVNSESNPAYNGDYRLIVLGSSTKKAVLQRNYSASFVGSVYYKTEFLINNSQCTLFGKTYALESNTTLTTATIGTNPIHYIQSNVIPSVDLSHVIFDNINAQEIAGELKVTELESDKLKNSGLINNNFDSILTKDDSYRILFVTKKNNYIYTTYQISTTELGFIIYDTINNTESSHIVIVNTNNQINGILDIGNYIIFPNETATNGLLVFNTNTNIFEFKTNTNTPINYTGIFLKSITFVILFNNNFYEYDFNFNLINSGIFTNKRNYYFDQQSAEYLNIVNQNDYFIFDNNKIYKFTQPIIERGVLWNDEGVSNLSNLESRIYKTFHDINSINNTDYSLDFNKILNTTYILLNVRSNKKYSVRFTTFNNNVSNRLEYVSHIAEITNGVIGNEITYSSITDGDDNYIDADITLTVDSVYMVDLHNGSIIFTNTSSHYSNVGTNSKTSEYVMYVYNTNFNLLETKYITNSNVTSDGSVRNITRLNSYIHYGYLYYSTYNTPTPNTYKYDINAGVSSLFISDIGAISFINETDYYYYNNNDFQFYENSNGNITNVVYWDGTYAPLMSGPTTQLIQINDIFIFTPVYNNDNLVVVKLNENIVSTNVKYQTTTQNNDIFIPNKSGIIALLDDMPNLQTSDNTCYIMPNTYYFGTPEINNRHKPFYYITDAHNALNTSNPQNRGLIHVCKGTYTSFFLDVKDNVDYYFEPGVTLINSYISDNMSDGVPTCNIYGYVNFINSRFNFNKSTIYIEFDKIYNTDNRLSFYISGTANVIIVGNEIKNVYTGADISGYNISIRGTSKTHITIKGDIIWDRSTSVVIVDYANIFYKNFKGISYIKARNIISLGMRRDGKTIQNEIFGSEISDIRIDSNIIHNNVTTAGYGAAVMCSYGKFVLNGNITSLGGHRAFSVYQFPSSLYHDVPVDITINGNITTDIGNCIFLNWATPATQKYKMTVNGTITTTNSVPIVTNNNNKLFINNSTIKSMRLDTDMIQVNATELNKTNKHLYIYNTLMYGNGTAFCVNSPNDIEVSFHNTRSNYDNNTTIADTLSPSGFIYDTNLLLP